MFFVERKNERSDEVDFSQSAFADTDDNFEFNSSPEKTEEGKLELEPEAITQEEEKDISNRAPQSHNASEIDIEKAPITDGINWEEFVSITRTKSEEANIDIKTTKDLGLERKENESEFNWAKLSIDEDSEESLAEPPKLFDEALEEVKNDSPASRESTRIRFKPEVPRESRSNMLTVDNDQILITKKENLGPSSYASAYSSTSINPQRPRGLAPHIIKQLAYAVIILFILTIIIGAGIVILANQGLIPQETVSRISESVLSKLHADLTEGPGKNIMVTDLSARWISTRNGLVYVVSGNVINQSKYAVNYVKIKSEFISDGKSLFEQFIYAGNTFTENELQTWPIEAMLQKLNRKNGDINFDNPKKLAGLNYGIEPGESVPFFTIFPSESRILGLKYYINVTHFQKTQ